MAYFLQVFSIYNQLLFQLRYHNYKCNPSIYFCSITHLKGALSVTCFCASLVVVPSQSCRICTLTALIRVCHTSVNSGELLLTRLAFCVHAGHVHSGMDSIAMDGASNVNVPPWRMGSLERNMPSCMDWQCLEPDTEEAVRRLFIHIDSLWWCCSVRWFVNMWFSKFNQRENPQWGCSCLAKVHYCTHVLLCLPLPHLIKGLIKVMWSW